MAKRKKATSDHLGWSEHANTILRGLCHNYYLAGSSAVSKSVQELLYFNAEPLEAGDTFEVRSTTARVENQGVEPPYYVRALALGVPPLLLGIHLAAWITFFSFPGSIRTRADFRSFYSAGYMVRSGYATKLYDYATQMRFQNEHVSPRTAALPFVHLPYEALLFAPFSLLRYQTAYIAFLGINAGLLSVLLHFANRFFLGLRATWFLLPAGILAGFFPLTIALMLGQDSIVILAFLGVAVILLNRGCSFRAGLTVGLGLFKFQVVLPIAFLFLLWRRWRFLAGFSLSATGLIATSIAIVGWAQVHAYLKFLFAMSIGAGDIDYIKYGFAPEVMPNLRGLIFFFLQGHLSSFWLQAVTVAASGLLLISIALSGRFIRRESDALLVAITAATLVSYHMLIHDLSILLIPIVITLDRFMAWGAKNTIRDSSVAWLAALLMISPSFLFLLTKYLCLAALPSLLFLAALLIESANRRCLNLPRVPTDIRES